MEFDCSNAYKISRLDEQRVCTEIVDFGGAAVNIVGNVCLFLAVAIENVTCLWFMREMVYKRERALKNSEITILLILVTGISFLEVINRAYVSVFSRIMLLFKVICLCIPIFVIRRKKIVAVFTITVTYITLIMLADFFIECIFSVIVEGYSVFDIYVLNWAFIRKVYMLLLRIAGMMFCRFIANQNMELYSEKISLISSAIGYVSMMHFYSAIRDGVKAERAMNIIWIVVTISILVLSFFASSFFNKKVDLIKQENKLLEQEREKFYDLYKENRYLSHDLKNHINLLYQLMEREEYERVVTYMEKLRVPVKEMEEMFCSGNRIIDLVLNDKKGVAADKNINLTIEINHIGVLPIADQDICVIMTNLLDNAIEACAHIESGEKWIHVIMKRDGNIFQICIENSFQDTIIQKNGNLISNKADNKRHGIGIESVKYVADKYHGDIKQEIRAGIFCCSMVLFL